MLKLLNISKKKDEVVRLQSQIPAFFNMDTADFILENGQLKAWQYGDNGYDFYPINVDYEIVGSEQELM
jgi:hypothetical protein